MDPGTLLLGIPDPGDIDICQMFLSLAATFVAISARHGRYRSGNYDHSDQYHGSVSRLLVQSIFNQLFCRSIIPRSWTQQKLFWLRSEQDAAKNWERTRKNRNCKKYKKRYRSRVSTFSLTNISLIFFFPSFAPSGDQFYLFRVLSILVENINCLVPEGRHVV